MAQHDVYRLKSGEVVLDCQSDYLWQLSTRIVVPLIPIDGNVLAIRRLNPVVQIDGEDRIMMTNFLTAIPAALLRERIASVREDYIRIEAALDTLTGSY